jgi:hypothetical protein
MPYMVSGARPIRVVVCVCVEGGLLRARVGSANAGTSVEEKSGVLFRWRAQLFELLASLFLSGGVSFFVAALLFLYYTCN